MLLRKYTLDKSIRRIDEDNIDQLFEFLEANQALVNEAFQKAFFGPSKSRAFVDASDKCESRTKPNKSHKELADDTKRASHKLLTTINKDARQCKIEKNFENLVQQYNANIPAEFDFLDFGYTTKTTRTCRASKFEFDGFSTITKDLQSLSTLPSKLPSSPNIQSTLHCNMSKVRADRKQSDPRITSQMLLSSVGSLSKEVLTHNFTKLKLVKAELQKSSDSGKQKMERFLTECNSLGDSSLRVEKKEDKFENTLTCVSPRLHKASLTSFRGPSEPDQTKSRPVDSRTYLSHIKASEGLEIKQTEESSNARDLISIGYYFRQSNRPAPEHSLRPFIVKSNTGRAAYLTGTTKRNRL